MSEIKIPFKTLNDSVGKTYQPNTYIHENKEGLYIGQTNGFGFVGNITLKKKFNVYRIAVFGDSFTEAFQLSEKYNFTKVLQQKLNSNLQIEVEVLNFGMSNASFAEMYIRKKNLAEQFNIDLFVYILDSYDFSFSSQGIINSVDLVDNNGILQIQKNTNNGFKFYKKWQPIIDNSSYFNICFDSYLLYKKGEMKPILFDKFYKKDTIENDYSYYDYFLKNLSKENKLILSEIEKEPTVFVFRENGTIDLKQSLKQYKIPIIETKGILDELRNKGIDPYYWKLNHTNGHFNYKANQALGCFLADTINHYILKK